MIIPPKFLGSWVFLIKVWIIHPGIVGGDNVVLFMADMMCVRSSAHEGQGGTE